jgi:superfamily II DNA/RNA helicase
MAQQAPGHAPEALLVPASDPTLAHLFICNPPPHAPPVQVLLFSATLHSAEVKSLSQTICQNPILVDLKVGVRSVTLICPCDVIPEVHSESFSTHKQG